MWKTCTLLAALTALILSGCGAAATPPPEASYAEAEVAAPAEPAVEADRAIPSGAEASPAVAGAVAAVERLVIKNATLSLVVKDPTASVETIAALAESLGGFVVSSNVYQASVDTAGNTVMQATITIRVPADRLQTALKQIKDMAVTVNHETISGEDVTAQYTDLESQLRNLEAAEAQLQNIMDGATRTQDVLEVYNQLVSIRSQIEQVKGQMKYYREAAALSAISIDLVPDALSQPLVVGGWRAAGIAKDALEALVRTFQVIATLVIWLGVYLLPLGIAFGLPVYLVFRLMQRKFKKAKQAPTP